MEPITITLSDGVERVLRYSLATSKKLSLKFGASLFRGGLADIDENKLGELVWNGLRDSKGNPPADLPKVTDIDELIEMREVPSIMRSFMAAWRDSNAPKNAEGDQVKTELTPAETLETLTFS